MHAISHLAIQIESMFAGSAARRAIIQVPACQQHTVCCSPIQELVQILLAMKQVLHGTRRPELVRLSSVHLGGSG